MKNSDFKMRGVASALYNVPGIDATPEQIANARKAVKWFNSGYPVGRILLLLRIKPKQCIESTLEGAQSAEV